MKRLITLFIALVVIFSFFDKTFILAYQRFDDQTNEYYDCDQYYSHVWNNYNMYLNQTVWPYASDRSKHVYTQFVDKINNDRMFRYAIDVASWVTSEDASDEKYVEVLLNMMALMDYELNDVMNHQVEADSRKAFKDYAIDVTGMILDSASIDFEIDERLNKVAGWNKVGLEFTNLVIDNAEDYKRLDKILTNYEIYAGFLTAIITYSNDSQLVDAAKTIKNAADNALLLKVEQFSKSTGEAIKFVGKDIFFDNYVIEQLSEPQNWSTPDKNIGPQIFKAYDVISTGIEISKNLGVFSGDMLVGSSDMFNRVTEMRILSSVFDAIVKDMDANKGDVRIDNYDAIDRAYKDMCYITYINARGDYCLYNMIQKESQLLSLLFNDRATTEKWYDGVKNLHQTCTYELSIFYPDLEWFKRDLDTVDKNEEAFNLKDYVGDYGREGKEAGDYSIITLEYIDDNHLLVTHEAAQGRRMFSISGFHNGVVATFANGMGSATSIRLDFSEAPFYIYLLEDKSLKLESSDELTNETIGGGI